MLQNRLDRRLEIYRDEQGDDRLTQLQRVNLGERFRRVDVAREQLLARDYARSYPFLDEQVLHSLSGLPGELKQHGRFCQWAIRQLCPEIARLSAQASITTNHMQLSEYDCWLNTIQHDLHPLRTALRSCDLSEQAARRGLDMLSQGKTYHHVLSVLGAYSGWLRYLAAQRAARITS